MFNWYAFFSVYIPFYIQLEVYKILHLLKGGVTLHSFAGIGAGDFGLKRCFELAERVGINWRKCKRLIIDEISMVDGVFFEVSSTIVATFTFLN